MISTRGRHDHKVRNGINKHSEKSRMNCVLSIYKYLVDNNIVSNGGAAETRYIELLGNEAK